MQSNELIHASATTLARLIREKEVSSEEVVNASLERIDAVNPRLNAVVQSRADAARSEAVAADAALARGELKGALHGVPVTIKDALETAGVVSSGGTSGRASFVPAQDATAVARLRAAGAIIAGTTNVPEMSFAYETDNLIYGRTNNPYDLSRVAGGSSGGEAAIIAAGGSPLGLGADFAGSIRLPAHFCGIAGLKPTVGRVPSTGYFPPRRGLSGIMGQSGPMARYVEDLSLMLPIIAGLDWRDPSVVPMPLEDPERVVLRNLRVAYYTDNGIVPPSPETAEAVVAAVDALADAGVEVEERRPPGIEQSFELFFSLIWADGGAGLERGLRLAGTTEPHPILRDLLERSRSNATSAAEFLQLWGRWDTWRSEMLAFMEAYDLIISPACAYPAMPHGTTTDNWPAFSYLQTYSLTSSPGVVVRAGTSPEGLPIGIQLVPRHWHEEVALAAAHHLEMVLGGWQPPPL